MKMHAVRIPVPRAEELRADVSELLPLIAPPGREPARTMAVLARQPDLLSPFLGWAAALALTGVLPHRDHELLALRVASNCGSEFEWVEHAEYARAAGLADDEVAMVARSIDEGTWSGAPSGFAYVWLRCDATGGACAPIAGATANTYVPGAEDSGMTIRVAVTGSNTVSSQQAISLPSAPIP